MEAHLRAGVAIYNAGGYHAAHDAWEERWLDLERGSDDEQFLHGLIQFTAAVHHARRGNWAGTAGLCDSAREYLAGLGETYRGVNVGTARAYLEALRADPERIERAAPPKLTYEGRALVPDDLDLPAAAVAAEVLAEELGYDEEVVGAAAEYARADLEAGEDGSRFVALVMDFASGERRDVVYRRLREHVERRQARERDVDGLFPDDR